MCVSKYTESPESKLGQGGVAHVSQTAVTLLDRVEPVPLATTKVSERKAGLGRLMFQVVMAPVAISVPMLFNGVEVTVVPVAVRVWLRRLAVWSNET